MKTYIKSTMMGIVGAMVLLISCKRENISPSTGNETATTSSAYLDNDLFTIKNTGPAALHVISRLGYIYINNEKPGTNLGGGSDYVITANGKSYTVQSSNNFSDRTNTGLFGLVTISKDGKKIFEENYDTSQARVCGTLDGNLNTEDSGELTLKSIGASKVYWTNGSTIKVKFINNNGSSLVQQKIMQYAHLWETYANIKFKLVSSTEAADIRITISNDGSSYTAGLGKQLAGDGSSESMHYGWFTDATPDIEFRRTVVHEFGHALGLQHEQRHRDARINESAYFSYLAKANGWSVEQAKGQSAFFTAQDDAYWTHQYSTYDRLSIMHYPVPASCTTDGIAINSNTTLSAGDIKFIGTAYPFDSSGGGGSDGGDGDSDGEVSYTGTVIYSLSNTDGEAQIDFVREKDGKISIYNKTPGLSLNSTEDRYVILTRTRNLYSEGFSFLANTPLPAKTVTGITNLGPTKGQSILIQKKTNGQERGTILIME